MTLAEVLQRDIDAKTAAGADRDDLIAKAAKLSRCKPATVEEIVCGDRLCKAQPELRAFAAAFGGDFRQYLHPETVEPDQAPDPEVEKPVLTQSSFQGQGKAKSGKSSAA